MKSRRTADPRWRMKSCINCDQPDWMFGHRKTCAGCHSKKFLSQVETQKRMARRATVKAIREGKLVRQPCIACTQQGSSQGGPSQAHHEDYSKPLDVVWLCPLHHRWHHHYGRQYRCNASEQFYSSVNA